MKLIQYDSLYTPLFNHDPNIDFEFTSSVESNLGCLAFATPDNSFIGIEEGLIMGIGGVLQIWPGLGQAYVCLDKNAHKNKIGTLRAIETGLLSQQTRYNYHRIQVQIVEANTQSIKMCKWLGFEYECTHKQMGPNKEDVITMVRLF